MATTMQGQLDSTFHGEQPSRLRSWLTPPDLDKNPDYVDAVKWGVTFKAKSCEGDAERFKTLREYSEGRYELAWQLLREIDKKCDALLALAGTVAGLVFAGTKAFQIAFGFGYASIVTGFGCFLLVILIVAITRRPLRIGASADTRAVAEAANIYTTDAGLNARIAGTLHRGAVGIEAVVRWKGQQLSRATFLFAIGITCLFAGLLVSSPPEGPARPATATQHAYQEALPTRGLQVREDRAVADPHP